MAKIGVLFFILCLAFTGSGRVSDRNLLKTAVPEEDVIALAAKEVGVRELTGHNDGRRIEEYLTCVGLKKGDPYCAAYVSFIYKLAGYPVPRTGWSPDLFPAKRRVKTAFPADVFGIYIQALGRIGHCGIVEKIRHDQVYTLEANTNGSGGREGDGVYRRIRHLRSIRYFANWKGGDR